MNRPGKDPYQEAEANRFACELLMPFELLKADMVGVDMTDDLAFAKLAKKYAVPVAVLAYHVGQLKSEGAFDD